MGTVDIVHVKDSIGHQFATRLTNVFVIGSGKKPLVSLPKGKGIRLSIAEEVCARARGEMVSTVVLHLISQQALVFLPPPHTHSATAGWRRRPRLLRKRSRPFSLPV
jgi:hypothetical protein